MANTARNEPGYLEQARTGELRQRVAEANANLAACNGCGWACGVNRFSGATGRCRMGMRAMISTYGPHLGEEDPLRGWRGSGTIFFTRCNLRCVYCQNHSISQAPAGVEVTAPQLAAIMLELQAEGCHNINLVSPSHVVAQILSAVELAVQKGLSIPLVYNTGGYDSLESLRLLDGVIDIYMPDMKYGDDEAALRFSGAPHYTRTNQEAVKEMHRQVGDLYIGQDGLAQSGLLVRHLLLPGGVSGAEEVFRFLADEVSKNTYLNIMDQYQPVYNAPRYPEINRRINSGEYQHAVQLAHELGLNRLDRRKRLM